MPDDLTAHARARGAEPVTIRAPGEGTRMARHAAWRQPEDHPEAPRIDRLHAIGALSDREYQNACALAELCRAAGIFRSGGVAEWMRLDIGRAHDEGYCPEDELRGLIRTGGVDFAALLMVLDPHEPPVLPYMFSRARRALARLDALAARWDGQRWGEE